MQKLLKSNPNVTLTKDLADVLCRHAVIARRARMKGKDLDFIDEMEVGVGRF